MNDSSLQPKWLNPQLPREGRYVLGPLLGKGGMGEVMEAWDVVLCRTVALKALREMEPAAMIRFMHEAQVQARVVHPNICRIYDIESSDGTLKITMQLVKGPSLEQAAKQLSVDEVVGILCQVTEAVHAAHRVNLIHRDIKPSNILLERTADGPWIPYLCDFGLAVSLGEPAMTMSNSVVGTPAYMAPEQTRGDRERIAPATDVYALGGTLHYALLGFPPGAMDSSSAPRRGPRPGLPRDLDTIIRKCLEPDPERRYPTALALAEDLWRFRNGEPIHARPRRRWRRFPMRLPRRGHRLVPALCLGLALATLLAGRLGWALEAQARDEDAAMAALLLSGAAIGEFRASQLQPPHDLGPARALVAARMAAIRARMAKGGLLAKGMGWYALGRCHLLLGDYEEARADAERMDTRGLQGHNRQSLQTLAQAATGLWRPDLAPGTARPAPQAGEERDEFLEAAGLFNGRDYAHAAVTARLALTAKASHQDPAGLEAATLCALGRQRYRAGDLPGAQEQYQEARVSAQKQVEVWKSSTSLHHALAQATLGLAEVQWERGQDPMPLLKELGVHSDLALELEPDAPALLEDWLGTRFLTAKCQNALGGDARPGLEGALTFMATRVKEPATPALQAARMVIFWQMAEARAQHGQDPGPALLEALRASLPTESFNRDYLGEVLNFKARFEVSRGQDPRPTLDNNLGRLQAGIQANDAWTTLETAAEAWFIRADWEAGRAMDPAASLASLHRMADQALRIYPGAPSSNVLKGLAFSMEIQHDPSRRALLLPAARERLKSAQASRGAGRLLPKLEHDLSSPT